MTRSQKLGIGLATWLLLACAALALAQPADNGIVFVSTRGGYRDIYWMSADGETVEQLTNDIAQDLHPAWSPDGTQIAFVSDRDDSYAIYVMNPDGSGVRRIVSGNGYYEFPTWSPDGQNLVYSSDEAGSFDLYRVDLTGGQPYRLTASDEYESDPTWSPDGRQIAYLQSVDGVAEIFVIDPNGGSPRPFIPGGDGDFAAPRWSPDGQFLAYAVTTFDNVGNITELYIYDWNTRQERLLLSVENAFITGISWSSSSDELVYTHDPVTGGGPTLHRIGLNGDNASVLTREADNSEFPSWSSPAGGSSSLTPYSAQSCPDVMQSRLIPGELGRVVPGEEIRVRSNPSLNGDRLGAMPSGRLFVVVNGPICADGYAWWEIYHNLEIVYAAESGDGDYWLEPIGLLEQPRLISGSQRTDDWVQYAYEPFEQGYMFWVQMTDQIFVLIEGQPWQVFSFSDDDRLPEVEPSLNPPSGLVQPLHGFGLVWRENPSIQDQIGWATYREVGYQSDFEYDPATGTIVLYDPVGLSFTLYGNGTWQRG